MASSGGIGGGRTAPPTQVGGVETVNVGAAQITGGKVSVAGKVVDVNTPEGAATLMGAVSADELSTIMTLLTLEIVDTPEGKLLVPNDKFSNVDTAAIRQQLGPTSTDAGLSELDGEISAFFESEAVPSPYNANTTPKLYEKVKDTKEFKEAVSSMTEMFANPTHQNQADFVEYMQRIEASNPHGNIMELLFLVFRESIKEAAEDKKYFLQKLKMFNDMGEALSNYLSELVDASRDLGAAAAGAKYPEMVLTASPVTIKKFDLSTTNAEGGLSTLMTKSKRLDRAGLNDTIKEVESMQETVRNKRQMASTAFQNFDQKSNQLYNLMASVMKAMNEMRMGTVRNML